MAERLVYKPECGCEVYRIMHSKPNLYRIQYCPKHTAAPKMYEALKAIEKWEKIKDGEILKMIKQALQGAEGKG